MKKLLTSLFLVAALSLGIAATPFGPTPAPVVPVVQPVSVPTVVVPASAYAVPSSDDIAYNADYWTGYRLGQSIVPPAPAKYVDYAAYRKAVDVLLKPTAIFGWINSFAVGYDGAIIDAANWLYLHDPDSPHNKVVN